MKKLLIFLFLSISVLGLTQSESITWPSQSIKELRSKAKIYLATENIDSLKATTFNFKGREYHAFSSIEQEWILLIKRDFLGLLNHVLRMERHMVLNQYIREFDKNTPRGAYFYSEPIRRDDLNLALRAYIASHHSDILEAINTSKLADDDKSYLTYYVVFTLYQFDFCDLEKQKQAYYAAQNYMRNYPKSDFYYAVRNYSGRIITPGNWGFDSQMTLGGAFLLGDIGKYYNTGLTMDVSLGAAYKGLHLNLILGMIGARVAEEFVYEVTQPIGRYAQFRTTGLRIGYDLRVNDRFTLQPYVIAHKQEIHFGSMANETISAPMLNNNIRFGSSLMFDIPSSQEMSCWSSSDFNRGTAVYFGLDLSYGAMNFTEYVSDMRGGGLYVGGTFGFYLGLKKRRKL